MLVLVGTGDSFLLGLHCGESAPLNLNPAYLAARYLQGSKTGGLEAGLIIGSA